MRYGMLRHHVKDKAINENKTNLANEFEEKSGKRIKKKKHSFKYYKWFVILGGVVILLGVLLVKGIIPFYRGAKEIGNSVGEIAGEYSGRAVGSFKGIMEEIPKGLEDGKEQGLSAEDTEVSVETKIEEIGKLEVLNAGVTLHDVLEIGEDYKALYIYKADAVFTIDLKNAKIEERDNTVVVTVGNPSVEPHINEEKTEKLAEWQKHFYSGKAAEGYQAYINSRAEIQKKAAEEIEEYDTLMGLAIESAEEQIRNLVRSICGNNTEVEIIFDGE